jgi:hypothetical protein
VLQDSVCSAQQLRRNRGKVAAQRSRILIALGGGEQAGVVGRGALARFPEDSK